MASVANKQGYSASHEGISRSLNPYSPMLRHKFGDTRDNLQQQIRRSEQDWFLGYDRYDRERRARMKKYNV